MPSQFLQHVLGRRNRSFALTGVVLLLLATITWMYGGFAGSALAVPPDQFVTPKPVDHHTNTGEQDEELIVDLPKPADDSEELVHNPWPTHAPSSSAAPAAAATPESVATNNTAPTTAESSPAAADTSASSSTTENGSVAGGIPPKIWQILLPKKIKKPEDAKILTDPKVLQDTPSWLVLNPDHKYTLMSAEGGKDFIYKHFSDNAKLIETYNKLPNVGMKSDLLRYLVLSVEGGVYTDTDTVCLKPIEKWIAPGIDRNKVKVIVGIEFDRRDGGGWVDISHWVQFCQWTIAAAPGHPLFMKMAERVMMSADLLAKTHEKPLEKITPTSFEVMNSTGPAAWTDVVFEQLQLHNTSMTDTKDLSFMEGPKLFGDILVLPIDGFGMGQKHSKSTHDGTIPDDAYVQHLFRGSWRGDKQKFKRGPPIA
ncbi:glycosyltransferase [Podospora australis]|uniref:Glycosyltransferase n=1 Tax=Podospora australis TaxID=1536484 RepID=A0AAN6WNW8_9PEZI|nr:glycosyltransferase [Podospora australis]